jgi:hypothetical protein
MILNLDFKEGDDDYNTYPFTPADDYLALFSGHVLFMVHRLYNML